MAKDHIRPVSQSFGESRPDNPPAVEPPKVEPPAVEETAAPEPADEAPAAAPVAKTFRLTTPAGEVHESSATCVEDAIRELNDGGRGKVFTRKSLQVEEL